MTLFEVIEHLAHPREAIERIGTLLKDGGVAVIATPISDSPYCKSIHAVNDFWWNEPAHLCYFDDMTMRRYLEGAGLIVAEIWESPLGCGRLEYFAVKKPGKKLG